VGTLCFYNQANQGVANDIVVTLRRTGAPTTGAFQSALAGYPGAQSFAFSVGFEGYPSTPLDDGSTLALGQLATPMSLASPDQGFSLLQSTTGAVLGTGGGLTTESITLAP
jgi:hypothetical protein